MTLLLVRRGGQSLRINFNPNHDPGSGRFSSGGGVASASAASANELHPPPEKESQHVLLHSMQASDALDDFDATAVDYKKRICNQLTEQLKDDPDYRALVADEEHLSLHDFEQFTVQYGDTDIINETTRELVHQWASTSGDTNVHSIAMQRAVRDEFGLQDTTLEHMTRGLNTARTKELDDLYATHGTGLRKFARQMYDNTQAELAAKGITEMYLYRGMSFETGQQAAEMGLHTDFGHTHTMTVQQQPISSWTYDAYTWQAFTGGSVSGVLAAVVPAKRIFSTMKTGIGCKDEYEVVVLGGKDRVNVRSWGMYGQGDAQHDAVDLYAVDKSRKAKESVLNVDGTIANADWPKRHWDFWTAAGVQVSTLAELRTVLRSYTDADFVHMLTLPVAAAMPLSVRNDIAVLQQKFNPHHDPHSGRFSSGAGGGALLLSPTLSAPPLTWQSPRPPLDTSTLDAAHMHAIDPPNLPSSLAEQRLNDLFERAVKQGHADHDARWYVDKHNQAGEWADQLHVDRQRFTDAVAATSPLTAWDLPHSTRLPNLEAARAMVQVDRAHPDLSPAQIRAITPHTGQYPFMGNSVENAARSLRGEDPEKIFKAPKIRSFNNSVSHPESAFDVAVDTHMGRAMLNLHESTPAAMKAAKSLIEGRKLGRGPTAKLLGGYGWSADRVRAVAASHQMVPSAFQAVTWEQWRREGGARTTAAAAKAMEMSDMELDADVSEDEAWSLWQDVIAWAADGAPLDDKTEPPTGKRRAAIRQIRAHQRKFNPNHDPHSGRFTGGAGGAGGTEQARAHLAKVPRGRGATDGDGSLEHPINVGANLDRAVRLLAQGKHIRLNQPRQVATLLDKLAAIGEDAKAKGEKAGTYDLGLVTVPGTNLFTQESKGIPRAKMPQLSGHARPGSPASRPEHQHNGEADIVPAFRTELERLGYGVSDVTVPAASLRATQMDLDGLKVGGMMRAAERGAMPEQRIFVTRDNYVIDGHHRWAANVAVDMRDNVPGDVHMPVSRIDADIGAMLDLSNSFAKDMGIEPKTVKQALDVLHAWAEGRARKFNPNHDPGSGRFSSGTGGAGSTPATRADATRAAPPKTPAGKEAHAEATRRYADWKRLNTQYRGLAPDSPERAAVHRQLREASNAYRKAKTAEHKAEAAAAGPPAPTPPPQPPAPPPIPRSPLAALHALDGTEDIHRQERSLKAAVDHLAPLQTMIGVTRSRVIDFDDLTPTRTIAEAKMLGDLARDYPKSVAKLRGVYPDAVTRTGSTKANGCTSYDGDEGTIHLGSGFDAHKAFEMPIQEGDARAAFSGWHPPEAAEGGWTMAHEFGHVLDRQVGASHAITPHFWESGPNNPSSWWDDHYQEAIWRDGTPISKYATNNPTEAFAESFAAYYLGSKHPAALAAGAFVGGKLGAAPRRHP